MTTEMSRDDQVASLLLFDEAGSPLGVTSLSRLDAAAARFAFEAALAADDLVLLRNLFEEMDSEVASPAFAQRAFTTLLLSVLKPCLQALGPNAAPLREMFRLCADEFYSMERSEAQA